MMQGDIDLVLTGIGRLVTPRGGRGDLVSIERAAIVCAGGRIAYAGPEADLPLQVEAGIEDTGKKGSGKTQIIDARGGLAVPGLIDCHTHLVFAGDRASEFARRCRGESYAEIAAAGGGILRTVSATRRASPDELTGLARPRLRAMLRRGVTTVEVKSGYGLDTASELKMLEVAGRAGREGPLRVVPTFLGAHALPPEFRTSSRSRANYLELVIEEMLPAVAERGLARFCDAFVEEGAFSAVEARRLMSRARDLRLGVKLHVDQLTVGGGAELAAELGATSADHLDHISEPGIEALAGSGTTAVLLPGAALFLGGRHYPPARRLCDAGVTVALSTDFNPGSSPTMNLPLMTTLGCARMGMTPEETLAAVTLSAARALGLEGDVGNLEVGKQADIAVFGRGDSAGIEGPAGDADPARIPYSFGELEAELVVRGGQVIYQRQQTANR